MNKLDVGKNAFTLAQQAYKDMLEGIHASALEENKDFFEFLHYISSSGLFNENELEVLGQFFFLKRVVCNCFVVAKSDSAFVASVALEIVFHNLLKTTSGFSCHVKKCLICFEAGGYAEHYTVRVVVDRLLPSRQAFFHFDVGSHLYETSGLMPDSVIYGGIPNAKMVWLDELDAESKAMKKKNRVMHSLLPLCKSRGKYLCSIAPSLRPADRIAMHLAVGRLVPEWDAALRTLS